jgi:hypothetical protein
MVKHECYHLPDEISIKYDNGNWWIYNDLLDEYLCVIYYCPSCGEDL